METTNTAAMALWACDSCASGANTVTAHTSASVNILLEIEEYAGGSGFELIDSVAKTQSASTSSLTATTIDSCTADDLVVTFATAWGGSLNTPTGFTLDTTSPNTWGFAHKLDSGVAGAQSVTWTSGSTVPMAAIIATFRQTGVASTAQRLRQTTHATGSGTSMTAAFATNPAAGSSLVAVIDYFPPSGTATITSVTDTQGLTWRQVVEAVDSTLIQSLDIWVADNAAASADTLTINFSTSVNGADAYLLEFVNAPLLVAEGQTEAQTTGNATATSFSQASAAAVSSGDIIVGAAYGAGGNANVSRGALGTPRWQQAFTDYNRLVSINYVTSAPSPAATQTASWTSDASKQVTMVISGLTASYPIHPFVPNEIAVRRAMYR